jgi:hypothetical protein
VVSPDQTQGMGLRFSGDDDDEMRAPRLHPAVENKAAVSSARPTEAKRTAVGSGTALGANWADRRLGAEGSVPIGLW